MIYIMFAMAIANANGVTSITTAEFNSQKSCEEAKVILVENFTRSYFGSDAQRGTPELKIQCLSKGDK